MRTNVAAVLNLGLLLPRRVRVEAARVADAGHHRELAHVVRVVLHNCAKQRMRLNPAGAAFG